MLIPNLTSLLEFFGIHLDNESMENLVRHLRIHKLSFMYRTILGTMLMLLVKQLERNAKKIEPVSQ